MDDPKRYMKVPEKEESTVTKSDFLVAMQMLLETIKTTKDPATAEMAVMDAERRMLEFERLKRDMPENKQSPGISVYSHPKGDLAQPKHALKCKFFWCGIEEREEQLTPEEIDLRNTLEPGHYRVTKADGVKIDFDVAARYGTGGILEQMSVTFQCRNEHRHNHRSNIAYLRQAQGENLPSIEELMAELATMKAALAAAGAELPAIHV